MSLKIIRRIQTMKSLFIFALKFIGVLYAFFIMYSGFSIIYIILTEGYFGANQKVMEIFWAAIFKIILAFIIFYFIFRKRKKINNG